MDLNTIETIGKVIGFSELTNTLWIDYDLSLSAETIAKDAKGLADKHKISVGFCIYDAQVVASHHMDHSFIAANVRQALTLSSK
jgi:hypothetical protein